MADLDDLTPGTRVRHIETQTEGVVEVRARIGIGAPWRVLVRWPLGGGMWCVPDELETIGGSGLPDNETRDR